MTHGVVVVENNRCVFASDVLTREDAQQLAGQLAGARVVDVETLRMLKRGMLGQ